MGRIRTRLKLSKIPNIELWTISLALTFGNMIVYPFATYFYDLLLVVFFLVMTKKVPIKKIDRYSAVLFGYLLFRDFFTIFSYEFNVRILRQIILHISLLFLFQIFYNYKSKFEKFSLVVGKCAVTLFSTLLVTYALSKIINQDWNTWQGEFIAGSSAITISILVWFNYSDWIDKKNNILFIVLVLVISLVYSSRSSLVVTVISLLGIIAFKNSNRERILVLLSFVSIAILFASSTVSNLIDIQDTSNQELNKPKNVLAVTEIISSLDFAIGNPRDTDSDRYAHLKCIKEFIENAKLTEKLFGYGTDQHKYQLIRCKSINKGPEYLDGSINYLNSFNRSITPTALILDYGLLFILLIFGLILRNFREMINAKTNRRIKVLITISYLLTFPFSILGQFNNLVSFWFLIIIPPIQNHIFQSKRESKA